jgi:hypothetical protein
MNNSSCAVATQVKYMSRMHACKVGTTLTKMWLVARLNDSSWEGWATQAETLVATAQARQVTSDAHMADRKTANKVLKQHPGISRVTGCCTSRIDDDDEGAA